MEPKPKKNQAKISSDQRKIPKFLDDFIKDQKLVWKRSFDPDDVDAANIAYVTVDQGYYQQAGLVANIFGILGLRPSDLVALTV
ncbi:hypothetical protein N0V91_005223 [Didymella pomorum]|uniref:Uncharacterized protein n=1 Tax=Didymella pomorum TaxID=749634 RepID=A0A9W8ZDA0_9PLEO|nr:hypothetical protein N0V91_005223 [Didymella pomorum]